MLHDTTFVYYTGSEALSLSYANTNGISSVSLLNAVYSVGATIVYWQKLLKVSVLEWFKQILPSTI